MKTSDKILVAVLFVLGAAVLTTLVSPDLIAQTATLKGKEVRVIDATEAKLCLDSADTTDCEVEFRLLTSDTMNFYTSESIIPTISFISSTFTWMEVTSPSTAPGLSFPLGFSTAGNFSSTDAVGPGASFASWVNVEDAAAGRCFEATADDSDLGWSLRCDGQMEWGDIHSFGSNDTNLYRAGANSLKTDDDLTVGTLTSCLVTNTDANGKLACGTNITVGHVFPSTATYVSATGTAGTANTAQTIITRTLPANSLTQVGDRIRIRSWFFASSGAGIEATTLLGESASEVEIGDISHTGGAAFNLTESWLHYIDDTHANIIEQEGGGTIGNQSATNVAGFNWDAEQDIIVTQDAVPANFITVFGIFVDVFPKGTN